MKAYKLLRNIGGVLYSANPHLPTDMWVRYFSTRPTRSHIPKTMIYLFETELQATSFLLKQRGKMESIWKNDVFELWEVNTIGRVKKLPTIIPLSIISWEGELGFERRARLMWDKVSSITMESSPQGSIAASSIQLVQKLKTFESLRYAT